MHPHTYNKVTHFIHCSVFHTPASLHWGNWGTETHVYYCTTMLEGSADSCRVFYNSCQHNSSPLQKRTNGHCIYNKDKGAANKTHLSQGSAISTAIHLCGHTYVSSVFLGSCCKSHGINITILHVWCRQFFMRLVASLYLESLCTVASIFKYVWSQ